jgi:hypothetical protein|tara:strand:- start:1066 stop:1302 length:237 start_codon:yes stop_codon:yes gene_type:complete
MNTNIEKIVSEIVDFVAYVESFYGNVPDAIYPIGATPNMILSATKKYINDRPDDFCGDSLDRERVRDIMINDYGLEWK